MHFIGFIGIIAILALAFLLSNNRKAINYRTVGVGLLIQVILAVFILKTPVGKSVFGFLGKIVQKLLQFSDKGAEFIFGPLARDSQMQEVFGQNFIFFFRVMPTIIFIAVLVKIFYHLGILQWIIKQIAKDGVLFADYDFDEYASDDIIDFMHVNKDRLREVSLRMALKIADLRKSFPGNWKRMSETTCMKSA